MSKDQEKKEKKIPKKNYFALAIIFIVTFIFILYLCNWYRVYDNYEKQTPVIRGTISELTSTEELEHYVLENQTAVVYICTPSDTKCRSFEKDFKKIIDKKNLNDAIVYLNLSEIDGDSFINDFNNRYNYKVKLNKNYPAIIMFEDNKVKNLVQGTQDEVLTIEKAKQFIEINKIGE